MKWKLDLELKIARLCWCSYYKVTTKNHNENISIIFKTIVRLSQNNAASQTYRKPQSQKETQK